MATPKNTEFDKFVKRQQELAANTASEGQTPFDPKKELDEWIGRLNFLYSQVKDYLKDYISAGSISTSDDTIELNEEFSGSYLAPTLTIHIGLEAVRLVPIGTMLIGSKGRVDVVGRAGTSRLVLVNKKITSPRQMIQITIVDPKSPKPTQKVAANQIEWVWKIASRPPTLNFIELNKEAFLQIMLEVSNA